MIIILEKVIILSLFYSSDLGRIFNGDCLEVLKSIKADSIDSVVTDPPYGISFMGKKWDYDIPNIDVWKEVYRVLKPGGHILVACGTRTQHRMAVAIEDAGFEIRDIISWIYGSGFPKSRNLWESDFRVCIEEQLRNLGVGGEIQWK